MMLSLARQGYVLKSRHPDSVTSSVMSRTIYQGLTAGDGNAGVYDVAFKGPSAPADVSMYRQTPLLQGVHEKQQCHKLGLCRLQRITCGI